MNGPIRRLAGVVALLFASLLISTTYIQVVDAAALKDKPTNTRTLYKEYARQRGPITVSGEAIAKSVPSNDQYKYLRTYPGGKLYAPVTGYYSTVSGPHGIEATEDGLLSGTSDQLFYRRISDLLTGKEPAGAQVELTINPKAQQAAWDQLGDQRGAVVALDPKTGDILAMVSKPSYDPDALATHNRADALAADKKLDADEDDPLINRAIAGKLYPPGSTFKVITSAAALSNGYETDSLLDGPASLKLPGVTDPLDNDDDLPCGPNNKTTLLHALEVSCNTAYAALGMELGQQKMLDQAQKFGFNQQLTIPLRVTPSTFPDDLNDPQLAQSSIGQFEDRVTPLQMAMVSAAIANDGELMRPNLIKRVVGDQQKIIQKSEPQKLSDAVSEDVAQKLTTMMEAVVSNGTGRRAQIAGVKVAGKTGTAQHAAGAAPHAWFTCFAPADDPQVAVAVVVEDGGKLGNEAFGGTVAAPIAKAVMEAVLNK
ncbi:MAG TPA: penicillin-binding protein 2 [Kineosporiaceae bacterium]|nr:penicillin-binding protein 2 [Kineosporiaceae bacterium]